MKVRAVLRVSQDGDDQTHCDPEAVPEITIGDRRFKERDSAFFQPGTVIEVGWVDAAQHAFVPGLWRFWILDCGFWLSVTSQ